MGVGGEEGRNILRIPNKVRSVQKAGQWNRRGLGREKSGNGGHQDLYLCLRNRPYAPAITLIRILTHCYRMKVVQPTFIDRAMGPWSIGRLHIMS